ncbi:MAG TPA: hypothetical protein DD381_01550 [Lentisphaeria bacterium]|nr:MAG: hypothetical protein A2X47_10480 [Lentisphaerae bacterium GWF2_38_69]HBM15026.1 hypothetical protein [Lentisphaeria bacterium]
MNKSIVEVFGSAYRILEKENLFPVFGESPFNRNDLLASRKILDKGDRIKIKDISILKTYVSRYPQTPEFKHNLAMAYDYLGEDDECESILQSLVQEHPLYLQGIISLTKFMRYRDDFSYLEVMAGKKFDLNRICPARAGFLVGEIMLFYAMAIAYYLDSKDIETAERIHKDLCDVDSDSPMLEIIESDIEEAKEIFGEDELQEGNRFAPDKGYNEALKRNDAPEFINQAVSILYSKEILSEDNVNTLYLKDFSNFPKQT